MERRWTDVGYFVRMWPVLGHIGKRRTTRNRLAHSRRAHLGRAVNLVRPQGRRQIHGHRVGVMSMKARVAPRWNIDAQQNDVVIGEDRDVERGLFHGHRLTPDLGRRGLCQRVGEHE